MPLAPDGSPEKFIGSPAISDGRVFLVTSEATYCIGKKHAGAAAPRLPPPAHSNGAVAHVQVVPTELILKPGESVQFRAGLFDDKGQFIREGGAAWSLEQLKGTIGEKGRYTAPNEALAGQVKATVGGVSGAARLRVIPPLPWSEDFDSRAPKSVPAHWINALGKWEVREMDGGKVLVKLANNPFTKRARTYFGPPDMANYTVEVDARAIEKRRQMGDAGVVAQRYALILFGNHQRMELQSWQPETKRTVMKDFQFKPETWYHLKLRVGKEADGKVHARGKAWAASEKEPPAWMIERVDPAPNLQGSPGLYADATFEVFFDNLKVTAN
ncbi:MAG: hypothetical protein HYS04_09260 [Acidobacteria bacterium]|nr:hypothetical protein [Acidobacteriota bacterium]